MGGGAAIRAHEIGRRLASHHEVTLLSGLYPDAEEESTPTDQLRIRRVGSARSYPASRIAFAYQASAYLRHAAYDLWIYAFSAFAPLWVRPNSRRRGILEFHHLMQDALADAILRLCEDKDLRSTLGRSGRAWAERFSWDRVARDQEAVYLNVMASRERFDWVRSAV